MRDVRHSLFLRGLDGDGRTSSDQRARMLDAMTRAVAEKGYAAATVSDVVAGARVSRRTFYEQFDDKEDCFLAAYDLGATLLLGDVAEAVRAAHAVGWKERTRLGLEAYLGIMADEPDLARTLMIDVLGAGPRAVELRRSVLARFVEAYRVLRDGAVAEDPRLQRVPDLWLRALVGAIDSLVAEHVLTHGAQTLRELSPALTDLAVTVLSSGPGAQIEPGSVR